MRTCAKCGRTVGKSALRCLYCGAVPAEPPAPAAPARKPVLVTCPGCLRTARIAPGAGGACAFCALAFDVDDDGTARLGRTRATPAASRADVDRLVASLPPARLWDAVRDVLLRRAAFGELGAGEAERAIDGLTLIATWPATSPQWLPLSVADAVNVTRDAIARRLSALGCDSSPELVDQLCVRMPPVFGSQAVHSPR